jgi:hypothetical protein
VVVVVVVVVSRLLAAVGGVNSNGQAHQPVVCVNPTSLLPQALCRLHRASSQQYQLLSAAHWVYSSDGLQAQHCTDAVKSLSSRLPCQEFFELAGGPLQYLSNLPKISGFRAKTEHM